MFGEKLKSERTRLGFSQGKLSELLSTSMKTIVNWESDNSAPNGKQLKVMYDNGFDVMLILTGTKVIGSLADDEEKLLALYAKSSQVIKNVVFAAFYSEAHPRQIFEIDFDGVSDKAYYTESKPVAGQSLNQDEVEYAPVSKTKKPGM